MSMGRTIHEWWNIPEQVQRFEQRTVRRGSDECWEWTGTRSGKNYGLLYFKRHYYLAHRLSLERKLNCELGKAWALHTCDNPPCVNPLHLYAGSASDNMRDRADRGRMNSYQKGERNNGSKLTAGQVIEIKRLLDEGDLYQWQIAERFGVKQPTISEIKNGRHWRVLR